MREEGKRQGAGEEAKMGGRFEIKGNLDPVAGLWIRIRIRMDPHSFSLLDPDPGG